MMDDDSGVVDLWAEGLKTGIPPKSSPEAWLINIFNGMQRSDLIIASLTGYTDPRMYLHARGQIVKIPDMEIRTRLLRQLDEEIARIEGENLTNEEEGLQKIIAAQNALGGVMDYFDEFVGIVRTLTIKKI